LRALFGLFTKTGDSGLTRDELNSSGIVNLRFSLNPSIGEV